MGVMILFGIQMLLVIQEVTRWSLSQVGVTADFFGGIYLPVIILPVGWIFIVLGYWQFDHHTKAVKSKADQHNLTNWKNKSGTLLITLAIIGMFFLLTIFMLYIIFLLTLISLILQFFTGLHLRKWTPPDIKLPGEIMIPGR
jgi:uncharacterized membrane protein YidH (DUF202 family)